MSNLKPEKIIFIHGLMGSPHEWDVPAAMFKEMGIETHQICLPAHGDNPDASFSNYSIDDLYHHCTNELKQLSENKPVMLIGHSLGAALCVLLAANNPENIAGVVLMGCPYDNSAYTQPWQLFMHPRHVKQKGMKYLPDSLTGFKRPKVGLKNYFQFFNDGRKLFEKVQAAAPKIKAPVWLIHSPYDIHVPYSNTQSLAQALTMSSKVTQHTLENSAHQVFPKSNDVENALTLLKQAWEYLVECEASTL